MLIVRNDRRVERTRFSKNGYCGDGQTETYYPKGRSHRGLEGFYIFENHWKPPFLRWIHTRYRWINFGTFLNQRPNNGPCRLRCETSRWNLFAAEDLPEIKSPSIKMCTGNEGTKGLFYTARKLQRTKPNCQLFFFWLINSETKLPYHFVKDGIIIIWSLFVHQNRRNFFEKWRSRTVCRT